MNCTGRVKWVVIQPTQRKYIYSPDTISVLYRAESVRDRKKLITIRVDARTIWQVECIPQVVMYKGRVSNINVATMCADIICYSRRGTISMLWVAWGGDSFVA